MVLYVDKLELFGIGGFTKDLRKVEYILACHNKTFDSIIKSTPISTEVLSAMFGSGKYIIVFKFNRDLTGVSFGIINSEIDLEENFNSFADLLPPKAVAGFHKLQMQLKEKKRNELNTVEISDDNLDFEIAYRNLKNFQHRQSI
jgi:hypothetical protein